MGLIRAHLIISGFVQGVNFRYYTQREATRHGVTGWVKNLNNGDVEAVLEGEEEAVEKVISFCRRGPSAAMVKDVKVNYEEYKGEFDRFEIAFSRWW